MCIRDRSNTPFKLKTYKSEDKKLLLFQLYILPPTNTTTAFPDLHLTAATRFRLPTVDEQKNPIDPNLDPVKWEQALVRNHPKTIQSIRLNSGSDKIMMSFLEDKAQTLYHSLLYAKFHVNPSLQYDIDDASWCFIENTESLDKKIVR